MESIKIIASGRYLPKKKVINKELEQKYNLENGYIYKRTGIEQRYYIEDETIEDMALFAVNNLLNNIDIYNDIGLIIVATTTTNNLMPGISNIIQKSLGIDNCICLDILAGCSGYVNAFDIASMYIQKGTIKKALVIGVDILSKYTNNKDIGTSVILSDGAGAVLIEKSDKHKKYKSYIEAQIDTNEILICRSNENIYMNGKEIYKYAVTSTVKIINKLLLEADEQLKNIKYVIPHQSNIKIIKSICSRLKVEDKKMYTNIATDGNTFCASIPIALDKLLKQDLLASGDKIILLGYGGGLNTGSILLEI